MPFATVVPKGSTEGGMLTKRRRNKGGELRSIRSPQMRHDRSLHFQRINGSGLAIEHLAARRDHERIGQRSFPLLVEPVGKGIAVLEAGKVIRAGDVLVAEDF